MQESEIATPCVFVWVNVFESVSFCAQTFFFCVCLYEFECENL